MIESLSVSIRSGIPKGWTFDFIIDWYITFDVLIINMIMKITNKVILTIIYRA